MLLLSWVLHQTIRSNPGSRERADLLREALRVRDQEPYKDVDQAEAEMLRQVHR